MILHLIINNNNDCVKDEFQVFLWNRKVMLPGYTELASNNLFDILISTRNGNPLKAIALYVQYVQYAVWEVQKYTPTFPLFPGVSQEVQPGRGSQTWLQHEVPHWRHKQHQGRAGGRRPVRVPPGWEIYTVKAGGVTVCTSCAMLYYLISHHRCITLYRGYFMLCRGCIMLYHGCTMSYHGCITLYHGCIFHSDVSDVGGPQSRFASQGPQWSTHQGTVTRHDIV